MDRTHAGMPTYPNPTPPADKARDPATLSFIERISWFEAERPIAADNDNVTADSACFQSWALPDFMRK